MLTAIVSVQIGGGLAGRTFGQVAPAGMTGLRLWSAAIVMAAFGGKGAARSLRAIAGRRAWGDAAVVVAFGVFLAVMNFSFYQAIARIPLGIAVTIEFLGPLAVAVASSRRLVDLLWVGLAAAGVLLLTRSGAPLPHPVGAGLQAGAGTALAGVVFALVAAACWAGYILLSRSTGRRFGGSAGLVIAMAVSAVLVAGPAVAAGGRALLRPGVLAAGVAVGLLSSVIPYRLELDALRRIPARVFGIWMSLEPAVAALAGLVLLGQTLAPRQWAAIGCVIVACAGAARGGPIPAGTDAPPGRDAPAGGDGPRGRDAPTVGPERPAAAAGQMPQPPAS